eukprot:maker-scaffold_15-snap-gene-6.41-mRNA-1 protein AED:0.16 eAED:0.16 QI:123/1/1/1/1/1/2/1053/409
MIQRFQRIRHFSSFCTSFPEIRHSVHELCNKFPGKYWNSLESSAKNSYPTEFVQALTSAGFLGSLIPEKYGGSGLSLFEACTVLHEIHSHPNGCNGAAVHAQIYTMSTILNHGSEKQKGNVLPKISKGEIRLQAFGVSEPNSGTNTLALETKAKKIDGGYVINGTKIWTSRAEHSDYMLLLAKTVEDEQNVSKKNWLSTFLVDMNKAKRNGLNIKKIPTMINHNTCEVHFENVFVPEEDLVGREGEGFSYILDSMNAERLLIAAECLGDAKFFIDTAVGYAKERVVFGRPIGQNQAIQFPIAQVYAELQAAELLVREGAELYEEINSGERVQDKKELGNLANMSKLVASEVSWKAADICMQTFGGFAFAKEYNIERKWREARLYRIAPISTNIIHSYIAEKILDLPRSY